MAFLNAQIWLNSYHAFIDEIYLRDLQNIGTLLLNSNSMSHVEGLQLVNDTNLIIFYIMLQKH